MVAENQFKVCLANFTESIGLRCNNLFRLRRCRAADLWLVTPLDVDYAHAAGAKPWELWVVAEGWDLDAVCAAHLKNGLPLKRFELLSVDLYIERWRALRSLGAAGGEESLDGSIVRVVSYDLRWSFNQASHLSSVHFSWVQRSLHLQGTRV